MPRSNGVPLKFKDPLLYDTEEVDALYHSHVKLLYKVFDLFLSGGIRKGVHLRIQIII